MAKTVKTFIEESIASEHITKDTFVEVRDSNETTLGFSEAEEMLDSGAAYLGFEYTETDKDDNGNLIIVVEI